MQREMWKDCNFFSSLFSFYSKSIQKKKEKKKSRTFFMCVFFVVASFTFFLQQFTKKLYWNACTDHFIHSYTWMSLCFGDFSKRFEVFPFILFRTISIWTIEYLASHIGCAITLSSMSVLFEYGVFHSSLVIDVGKC